MLLLGKNITTPGDLLQPVEVEKVHKAICNSQGQVATLQRRLQEIRMIDMNQYRKLKTGLPYLVCAHFQPKVRKKENFVFTERFIVDIDHLSDHELDIWQLKKKLRDDPRIELLFTSPGGDGMKALFVLKDRISDSGYYALFYKAFCLKFAEQYQLGSAVDTKTNDVSRCCFVSYDADAYYCRQAEKVDASQYLPEEGALDFDMFRSEIKEKEKANAEEKKVLGIEAVASVPLTDDILAQIKEKVGVRMKKPVKKEFVQPEALDKIMPEVLQQLEEIGATLQKTTPIHYGRQLTIGAGKYWAEINLFYGQRGVKVVGTTKTGSNTQLCESMVALLKNYFQVV